MSEDRRWTAEETVLSSLYDKKISMSNEATISVNKEHGPGVRTIYDGTLVEMRQQGKTLQDIGNTVGVTRERIRQILERFYGGTQVKDTITETKLASTLGFSLRMVQQARIDGLLKPTYQGYITRYDASPKNIALITKTLLGIQKYCAHCGRPIPWHRKKYCPECAKAHIRNRYAFMSDEAKQTHIAATMHYRQQHPEKIKEISKRSSKKYRNKWSEQFWTGKPMYVLNRNFKSHSKGDVVTGVGCVNSQIKTLDGDLISLFFLRRYK